MKKMPNCHDETIAALVLGRAPVFVFCLFSFRDDLGWLQRLTDEPLRSPDNPGSKESNPP
jgi:hypothetical protein